MLDPAALDRVFPRYTEFDPAVPVWCVTPEHPRCQHRFFDTSPISPGGRYVGLTRFPTERRAPQPGDEAEVVVVDLQTGKLRTVATTKAWDGQLGAQVQWGGNDRELLFNDMDTRDADAWRPFAVRLDPATGERTEYEHTVYMASRDGTLLASPCLRRIGRTQAGYGALVPDEQVPVNHGAPDDDGVWITDTRTGESRLVLSLAVIRNALRLPEGDYYAFHVKFTPGGGRLMVVVRQRIGDCNRAQLVTCRPDGSDIRLAIPAEPWSKGGHHPDWTPDGQTVLMNLKLDGRTMRFVAAGFDGSNLRSLSDALLGSGHPSLHPDGRHLVTDTYLHESLAFGDGTVPIRFVDLARGTETTAVRIRTRPDCVDLGEPEIGPPDGKVLRVDPHPVWDRSYRFVTFNACPEGQRQVFIAYVEGLRPDA